MNFIETIKERAKQDVKTIVLPESNDRRSLIAAHKILQEGIANLIMIGKEEKIMDGARWLELDLSKVKVVDPETSDKFEEYAQKLFELREKKGMTLEKARDILHNDNLMWGVMMVKMNDADGMVAGACHATADVLRPSLQILRTAPGVDLVSGFFILDVPNCEFGENGTFLFADCGLNQDPTAEERIDQCLLHARKLIDLKGETNGIKEMRGHACWYINGLPNNNKVKDRINVMNTYRDLKGIMDQYLEAIRTDDYSRFLGES